MEKVMGMSSAMNCLARKGLNPISSIISAMAGCEKQSFSSNSEARRFETLLSPRKLPTKKVELLNKKSLLSIACFLDQR